jgi:hypothetical protein
MDGTGSASLDISGLLASGSDNNEEIKHETLFNKTYTLF